MQPFAHIYKYRLIKIIHPQNFKKAYIKKNPKLNADNPMTEKILNSKKELCSEGNGWYSDTKINAENEKKTHKDLIGNTQCVFTYI